MRYKFKTMVNEQCSDEEHIKREIERTNAKLRHFRGIAASVLKDAFKLWQEIWEDCQDSRNCDEILEGFCEPTGRLPTHGWAEFKGKLHLLGHYINYTQRLCEGSISNTPQYESEEKDV